LVKESIESVAHKRYLRSGSRVKTQISRENGHKRPAPVTDSAICNTSGKEDEELGEDLVGLDDLLTLLRSEEAVAPKRGRKAKGIGNGVTPEPTFQIGQKPWQIYLAQLIQGISRPGNRATQPLPTAPGTPLRGTCITGHLVGVGKFNRFRRLVVPL